MPVQHKNLLNIPLTLSGMDKRDVFKYQTLCRREHTMQFYESDSEKKV